MQDKINLLRDDIQRLHDHQQKNAENVRDDFKIIYTKLDSQTTALESKMEKLIEEPKKEIISLKSRVSKLETTVQNFKIYCTIFITIVFIVGGIIKELLVSYFD